MNRLRARILPESTSFGAMRGRYAAALPPYRSTAQ